jgi:hypothetical protein
MARKTAAPTQKAPSRAPRKPSRASEPAKGGTTARKPATGRRTARKTGPTKPNPFDAIARQVKADQEAKDREAGRDDLTPALAKSVDQAKAKRSGTSRAAIKPAKPARPAKPATLAKPAKPATPGKVQGNGKTFNGRPVSDPAKVAARVKEAGLRIRADADVDAIAARLRATPAAVSAWLATRNGVPTKTPAKSTAKQPAKAKADAKPKQVKPDKTPTITLGHVWADKKPDWLYRCTLVNRYEVRPDGSVWSTLDQVLSPDGKVLEDFWRLPLDYRPTQEVQGNGRKVILKDRTIAGLQTWLIREGLTTADDITT